MFISERFAVISLHFLFGIFSAEFQWLYRTNGCEDQNSVGYSVTRVHTHTHTHTLCHVCTHTHSHTHRHTDTHTHTHTTVLLSLLASVAVLGRETWANLKKASLGICHLEI